MGGSDRIRVGVAGTGFAAASHLDALARVPGVEVVAVAGSDRERAKRVAAAHGIERAYASHAELLDHDGLDAVHNCTINRLHHEVSMGALERGLHVLSEKPLALDRTQSAELAEAAARGDSVAAVCFNYRHYPLVAQIRAMLETGEYGAPHFVHGGYLQDWLLLPADWNWRLEAAHAGLSRAVADIGSHWADLVQHVTGDPIVEVFADLATLHAERLRPEREVGAFESAGEDGGAPVKVDTEDYGTILVRFASGARGSFVVSQTSAGRKNELWFEVDTANAAFVWHQEDPNRAWVGRRDAPNLELTRDPAQMHQRAARLTRLPAGHPEGWRDALSGLMADFYGAVRAASAGQPYDGELATFQQGHERVCLVDAIVESNRDERWMPAVEAGTSALGTH
jgi:predicted dehydrogenase